MIGFLQEVSQSIKKNRILLKHAGSQNVGCRLSSLPKSKKSHKISHKYNLCVSLIIFTMYFHIIVTNKLYKLNSIYIYIFK